MNMQISGGDIAKLKWAVAAVVASGALALASSPSIAQTVLRASGTGSNPPYHYLDPATNAQRGIAVDIINAVAADLGMTVEWGPQTTSANLVAAFNAGSIDIFAGSLSSTPARLAAMAMTIPWNIGVGDGAWVLKTDTTDYRSIEDFQGMVVGAVGGSGYATALQAVPGVFAEVRLYATPVALAQAVVAGEVRGGILSGTTAAYTVYQGTYPELKVPANYHGTIQAGDLGRIPISKTDPELVASFNDSLAKMMANGTITRIFADYGLTWPLPQ